MKKLLPFIIILSFAVTIVLIFSGHISNAGIPMVTAFIASAVYGIYNPTYKKLSFTSVVFAFLAAAMYYPFLFTDWGFNTKVLVIPMLQLIMFGMGTKLSMKDFKKEMAHQVIQKAERIDKIE